MNDNSKLISVLFIEKGLYKLLLAGPRVHYASQKSPINIEIWHQYLGYIDYKTISNL